jgi:hypothetical protein
MADKFQAYVVAVAAALALSACRGELVPLEVGPVAVSEGADGGIPQASGSPEGQAFFEQMVQPQLTKTRPLGACTNCHQGTNIIDGPDFLGATPADNYSTLMASPRIMSGDPATSLLVTRGAHAGDAFPPEDKAIVDQWIQLEGGRSGP